MTSTQRMLAAIEKKVPDRLLVTTHHIMHYFLDTDMKGISFDKIFNYFSLDPIVVAVPPGELPYSNK